MYCCAPHSEAYPMNLRAEIELKAKQFRNGEITIDAFNEFLTKAEGQQAGQFRQFAESGRDSGLHSKALSIDDDERRLAFGPKTAAAFAKAILPESDGVHAKAVAPSGAAVVAQEFQPGPIPL